MTTYNLYLSEIDYEDRDGGEFTSLSAAVAAARQHIKNGIRAKAHIEWHDKLDGGLVSENIALVDYYKDGEIVLDVD